MATIALIKHTIKGVWKTGPDTVKYMTEYDVVGSRRSALCLGCNYADTSSTQELNEITWTLSANVINSSPKRNGAGKQTAALRVANGSGGLSYSKVVESYDGTSWSSETGTNYNRDRGSAVCGLQTSALVSGCDTMYANTCEEYNGTSWSFGGNMPDTFENHGMNGSQNDALVYGGAANPGSESYTYNGSSWTRENDLAYTTAWTRGFGGYSVNGRITNSFSKVQKFEGGIWTIENNTPTERYEHGSCLNVKVGGEVYGGIVQSKTTEFLV